MRDDAKPREIIRAIVGLNCSVWHGRSAYAVKSVASGDEIALDGSFRRVFGVTIPDNRALSIQPFKSRRRGFEQNRPAGRNPRGNEILHHLLLSVDRDGSTGQAGQIQMDDPAAESDIEAGIDHALALQATVKAQRLQGLDRAPRQNAGARTRFQMGAAASFQNDGIDTGCMKKM